MTTSEVRGTVTGGIGQSPPRPDGNLKVKGEFAYSSDLWAADMLWGATLRSPHAHARITSLDIAAALAVPGVHAVLTHTDVPGRNAFGLEHVDQPVLAVDRIRYQGEAIAIVAADHPETARRAMERIAVGYEVLEPVIDSELAAHEPQRNPLHDNGNLVRHVPIRRGDPDATAEVVVSGVYHVGMQDQAFLGPESGLAVPAKDGGVELYVATQWLHVDQGQVALALGLPTDQVRITLAGVGGAFGAREDLSMQVHACLLALHTGRPVKMVYSREESFFGHVHRHPARMHYEHGATKDGTLVYVKARLYLDGGAYASTTAAVVANATTLGVGPYEVPNVVLDGYGVYTNNPPCGAMRGFGAVQACFGYESQMDKLAAALDMDPVELRIRNAVAEGSVMPTGQVIDSAAPVAELLRLVKAKPLPTVDGARDILELPGGAANTTHGEGVRRGVGYGVGVKNVCFSEGFDDYSTAKVRLSVIGGEPVALVHTAAAEVGQGLVTLLGQIARTELGVQQVTIAPADTSIGSAGSTSASRQSYVTGGATKAACEAVRAKLLALSGNRWPLSPEELVSVLGDTVIEETVEWRHRPTETLDPLSGQGNAHVQYAFAAHRAVVDVDLELGLVKVVELACAQDVGKALNPEAVLGQIQGGSAQGLGLAVMEEIQLRDGLIRNPSFTDYLIPTILDMPPMVIDVLELADPNAPYGLRGVGEPPTISVTPAIAAAIRAASGLDLDRVPVRPEHLTGT
ncbi:molybdopterin cofactor-binding domain-containing protein [Crossiella sp. CA198]|uniref:molybdopterin cofactor-binding domain-containing protein n=1 Tax=Crossiella sp. CA198 TaxID=3455607 RepID=UPI003F8D6149